MTKGQNRGRLIALYELMAKEDRPRAAYARKRLEALRGSVYEGPLVLSPCWIFWRTDAMKQYWVLMA